MIDKIIVEDPGWSWIGWQWTAVGVAILFVVVGLVWLLSFTASTRRVAGGLRHAAFIGLIIAACAVPAGAGVNAIVSSTMRSTAIEAEKQHQLEKLGYLNYEDESERYQFTAVKDNQYVRGVIIEYPEMTWQIMLLDMNVEKE
jgi:hypothetical protein